MTLPLDRAVPPPPPPPLINSSSHNRQMESPNPDTANTASTTLSTLVQQRCEAAVVSSKPDCVGGGEGDTVDDNSSVPRIVANDGNHHPHRSSAVAGQGGGGDGDSASVFTMGPLVNFYSIFNPPDTSQVTNSDNWPANMATTLNSIAVEQRNSLHDIADSSYDSDEDSLNTNSDMKKFVVDLVDSGNSTTPDDEEEEFVRNSFDNQSSNLEQKSTPTVVIDDGTDDDEGGDGRRLRKTKRKPKEEHQHEEVDRTSSETLSQEYSEYVTRQMITKNTNTANSSGRKVVNIDEDLRDSKIESLYRSKLEFALKLGYTEQLFRMVITKLGYDCEQNDLLSELVVAGSSVTTTTAATGHRPKQVVGKALSSPNISVNTLRQIVIDGSNVAMSHGKKEYFSCRGIQICVDWFKARGHQDIVVFVPMSRQQNCDRFDVPTKDQEILSRLENEKILYFTPSRNVAGRFVSCYDDRYILNYAVKNEAVIVSNDNFRDLISENGEYRRAIEERLLMYTFVKDEFVPPDDPCGQYGPTLDKFLSKPKPEVNKYRQFCPFDKRCTYGNKCKYFHPERCTTVQPKSVVEIIAEEAKQNKLLNCNKARIRKSLPLSLGESSTSGGGVCGDKKRLSKKKSLCSTKSIMDDSDLDSLASGYPQQPVAVKPPRAHRKLERQLTLNPEADPRLANLFPPVKPIGGNNFFLNTTTDQQMDSLFTRRKLCQTKSLNTSSYGSGDLFDNHLSSVVMGPVDGLLAHSKHPITKSNSVSMPVSDLTAKYGADYNGSHSASLTPIRKGEELKRNGSKMAGGQYGWNGGLKENKDGKLRAILHANSFAGSSATVGGGGGGTSLLPTPSVRHGGHYSNAAIKNHPGCSSSNPSFNRLSSSSTSSSTQSLSQEILLKIQNHPFVASNCGGGPMLAQRQFSTGNLDPLQFTSENRGGPSVSYSKVSPEMLHSLVIRNYSAPPESGFATTGPTIASKLALSERTTPELFVSSVQEKPSSCFELSTSIATSLSNLSLSAPPPPPPPPLLHPDSGHSPLSWSFDAVDTIGGGVEQFNQQANNNSKSISFEQQRQNLYYHLSSLFPAQQVEKAMSEWPHEVDPQLICASILKKN